MVFGNPKILNHKIPSYPLLLQQQSWTMKKVSRSHTIFLFFWKKPNRELRVQKGQYFVRNNFLQSFR